MVWFDQAKRWIGGVAAILAAILIGQPTHASDAGTRIANIAAIHYDSGGAATSGESNAVSLIVAERLDLTLTRSPSATVSRNADTPIAFVLTNTGNGRESFAVQLAGASGSPSIAIDRNGDGRYDSATDTLLPDGHTPELLPGATLALVAIADTSAVAPGGAISITATATTGSGAPGTAIPGGGDGGGDAVVGATGAAVSLSVPIDSSPPPTLTKSQSVLAPDGSARPVRGAVITYVLDAGFAAAADDARVDDPVPAGTRYVAGSLRLDGAPVADPADAGTIRVALGAVPAAASHRIQFQVQIL